MTLREHQIKRNSISSSKSISPWKDQLKQRCMERLKQNRSTLIAKLRSPEVTRSKVREELKRIVQYEEEEHDAEMKETQRQLNLYRDINITNQDLMDSNMVEDLLAQGKLNDTDPEYLELIQSLEDELQREMECYANDEELYLAQCMMEYEEASLLEMLKGLDIHMDQQDPTPSYSNTRNEDDMNCKDNEIALNDDSFHCVTCPICNNGVLSEVNNTQLVCMCGFTFILPQGTKDGLNTFQDKLFAAYLDHSEVCECKPTFSKQFDTTKQYDLLQITCKQCCFNILY